MSALMLLVHHGMPCNKQQSCRPSFFALFPPHSLQGESCAFLSTNTDQPLLSMHCPSPVLDTEVSHFFIGFVTVLNHCGIG